MFHRCHNVQNIGPNPPGSFFSHCGVAGLPLTTIFGKSEKKCQADASHLYNFTLHPVKYLSHSSICGETSRLTSFSDLHHEQGLCFGGGVLHTNICYTVLRNVPHLGILNVVTLRRDRSQLPFASLTFRKTSALHFVFPVSCCIKRRMRQRTQTRVSTSSQRYCPF